ncbi:DUF397 domain-containing protein [Streptomyces sp. NPDC051018]|uniref:DUF397 domain-containing protein n=1 Tax=Streptomyces sp. NPDC051018 TaxID=3365639 RepID=UPI00379B1438
MKLSSEHTGNTALHTGNTALWRKSTYSGGSGGDCLEVAVGAVGAGCPDVVPIRDSKRPGGPELVFRATSWSGFLAGLKAARTSRS